MVRKDMPWDDRLSLTIKDHGRKVVIKVNRGYAEVSEGGKLVTIDYSNESPGRKETHTRRVKAKAKQ